jgi:glucose-6-phosphate 1-dehydrogenase
MIGEKIVSSEAHGGDIRTWYHDKIGQIYDVVYETVFKCVYMVKKESVRDIDTTNKEYV